MDSSPFCLKDSSCSCSAFPATYLSLWSNTIPFVNMLPTLLSSQEELFVLYQWFYWFFICHHYSIDYPLVICISHTPGVTQPFMNTYNADIRGGCWSWKENGAWRPHDRESNRGWESGLVTGGLAKAVGEWAFLKKAHLVMGKEGQKSYWAWGMPVGLLGAWSHIRSCVTRQAWAGANISPVLFSDVCTSLSKRQYGKDCGCEGLPPSWGKHFNER